MCLKIKSIVYSGTPLYQYNETGFFIYALGVYKLFSNYNFTSNQNEAFSIDSFSLFSFLCVSTLLKGLI